MLKILKEAIDLTDVESGPLINDERVFALAKYLGVDVTFVEEIGTHLYQVEEEDGPHNYYVYTYDEARKAAEESLRDIISASGGLLEYDYTCARDSFLSDKHFREKLHAYVVNSIDDAYREDNLSILNDILNKEITKDNFNELRDKLIDVEEQFLLNINGNDAINWFERQYGESALIVEINDNYDDIVDEEGFIESYLYDNDFGDYLSNVDGYEMELEYEGKYYKAYETFDCE